jgi:hypothetical protein
MQLLAVNYHYYRTEMPASGIHPISPARFAVQIEQLARTWTIASERQVIEALEGGDRGQTGLCLITFDDGLKEQMQAMRWLMGRNLAAVCYVPTAPLVERRVLDVHKLHIIRSLRSDAELAACLSKKFGQRFKDIDEAAATYQYPYDGDVARQVKYFLNFVLDSQARGAWIDVLFRELAGDEGEAAEALYMDRDDLRELARRGMLGTHSHSHLPLARLGEDAVRDDIGRSLDILEDIIGMRARGISYPYGGPMAVDAMVGRVASEFGLAYGLTMRSGINDPTELIQPMLLARIDTNDVSTFLARAPLNA